MRVEEIWPVADIEGDEGDGEENESGLVDDEDQFWLRVLVAEEDGGELDQLDEHKHDAGDHPHVQAGHVRHSGNRSIKDFVSNEKLKFLKK